MTGDVYLLTSESDAHFICKWLSDAHLLSNEYAHLLSNEYAYLLSK